jgi:hypothetical protein
MKPRASKREPLIIDELAAAAQLPKVKKVCTCGKCHCR